MQKNKLALLFFLTTLSLSALGLSGTGHAQEACPDPTPHAEATPAPTPTPSPKAWDAGAGIGVVLDADGTQATDDEGNPVFDGRMTAPQDQTVPVEERKTPKVKVGGSLDCAVESASDFDHWKKDDNDGNDCTQGEEDNEADSVTYSWSGPGTFATPDSASSSWTAPTAPGHYTLTCDIDDTPTSVTAPETGDRDDSKISVSCEVIVYKLSVQFVDDEVAAGAVDDDAHHAAFDVIATDGETGVEGVDVDDPEITAGGLGGDDSITAVVDMDNSTTDSEGKAHGIFTSGNRTQDTTISVTNASETDIASDSVTQVWNELSDEDAWEYDPYFFVDEPETITYNMSYTKSGNPCPITQHDLEFRAVSISGWEWNPSLGTDGDYELKTYDEEDDDTAGWDKWGSLISFGSTSEDDGSYSSDMTVQDGYSSGGDLDFYVEEAGWNITDWNTYDDE